MVGSSYSEPIRSNSSRTMRCACAAACCSRSTRATSSRAGANTEGTPDGRTPRDRLRRPHQCETPAYRHEPHKMTGAAREVIQSDTDAGMTELRSAIAGCGWWCGSPVGWADGGPRWGGPRELRSDGELFVGVPVDVLAGDGLDQRGDDDLGAVGRDRVAVLAD